MAQHDTTEATAELAAAEARCDQILERLGLPTSCDITTFCRYVARYRQRPISLKPVPMDNLGQAVSGLWLAFPGRDVITLGLTQLPPPRRRAYNADEPGTAGSPRG